MNTKTTDMEVRTAADILASHLKSVNLGANLAKIADEHKVQRHPFSTDVVSLTALIKDVNTIKSLPMSAKRDNLLSNMEAYLNGEPRHEETIQQERQKNDALTAENWGLTQENQHLLLENQELQTDLSTLRGEFSDLEDEFLEAKSEHRLHLEDILSKYQLADKTINASPQFTIGKYVVMLIKL